MHPCHGQEPHLVPIVPMTCVAGWQQCTDFDLLCTNYTVLLIDRAALITHPRDVDVLVAYAGFLTSVRHDEDTARQLARKALTVLNPGILNLEGYYT